MPYLALEPGMSPKYKFYCQTVLQSCQRLKYLEPNPRAKNNNKICCGKIN